ncbi:hypothetical protein BDR03DRAFT_1001181 [Suillus americanus]|nr:hypothetical protein BDR03DRAFT_1001181 [Suillus americanus]
MDIQYVMTRKRKRPAYDSQGDEAPDLLHSETSMDMREPSLGLIPPIVTLPSVRDTTATKAQLLPSKFNKFNPHQEAVTVDNFIRQITARVPGPQRKRQLRTVQLQDTSTSTGGANSQPATRPAPAKVCISNGERISNKPVGDRKPMTLAQRLARAVILSHVETKEILHPPGVSSSRRPLNFVPFPKFATPPSSPRKKLIKRSAFSRSESSAVTLRNNRRQMAKRQPALERPGYPSLPFVPSHEAKLADTSGVRSHSESSAVIPDSSRRKSLKKQPTSDRPGYPRLTFIPSHEAEIEYAAMFPWPNRRRSLKRRPTSERPGYPPLNFIPSHEAEAGYAAMFPRRSLKQRPTSERPGYPPLNFIPSHEAEAGYAAMFPADRDVR